MEIKIDVEPQIWQRFTQMAHDSGISEGEFFSEMVTDTFEDFKIEHPETAGKLGLKPEDGTAAFPTE